MDMTFPHRYRCAELSELPARESLPRYYYPGASREGGRDGMLLQVDPECEASWVGVFAFGALSHRGISGTFTTPDPGRFCVVARGEGYLVHASDPACWEPVKAVPVLDVRPVRARGLLVFADYTELVAYGRTGLAWRTGDLVSDWLRITEVSDRFIRCEGDVFGKEGITLRVDLATGRHEGDVG